MSGQFREQPSQHREAHAQLREQPDQHREARAQLLWRNPCHLPTDPAGPVGLYRLLRAAAGGPAKPHHRQRAGDGPAGWRCQRRAVAAKAGLRWCCGGDGQQRRRHRVPGPPGYPNWRSCGDVRCAQRHRWPAARWRRHGRRGWYCHPKHRCPVCHDQADRRLRARDRSRPPVTSLITPCKPDSTKRAEGRYQ
jgi:hypothetical protein